MRLPVFSFFSPTEWEFPGVAFLLVGIAVESRWRDAGLLDTSSDGESAVGVERSSAVQGGLRLGAVLSCLVGRATVGERRAGVVRLIVEDDFLSTA